MKLTKNTTPNIQKLLTKIQADVKIDDTRLSNELKEQSSKFAYWSAGSAIKMQEYQSKKREIVEKEARLSRDMERKLNIEKQNDPKIRITDKVIKDCVNLDPVYKSLQEEAIQLGLEYDILNGAKEAFRQRAQMLLEMCRTERAEMTTPESVYHRGLMKEYGVTDG